MRRGEEEEAERSSSGGSVHSSGGPSSKVAARRTVDVALLRAARAVPLLLLFAAQTTAAQSEFDGELLPRTRFFQSPIADPIEPRFSAGLLVTDVLNSRGRERVPFQLPEGQSGSEWQASVALGGTIPLWRPVLGSEGGIVVGAQAGVFARFRVELPSRDDLGQDWIVALPVEAAWHSWSARIRLSHRSSHLGDEFAEATDARRIEFGGEALDALAAYGFADAFRVYGGGAWIFRSYTDAESVLASDGTQDRFLLQAGADGRWFLDRPETLLASAGVDWQAAERTGWRDALSVAAGLTLTANGRSLGLMARYFTGVSTMGQFFVTPENFWSLELIADL